MNSYYNILKEKRGVSPTPSSSYRPVASAQPGIGGFTAEEIANLEVKFLGRSNPTSSYSGSSYHSSTPSRATSRPGVGGFSDDDVKRMMSKFDKLFTKPKTTKLHEDKKATDFKNNLKKQFGFDESTANTMLKLYQNIEEKEGSNAGYVYNRILGGTVYENDTGRFGIVKNVMWKFTAGGFNELDISRKYHLDYETYQVLKRKIQEQHINAANLNLSDFAHQSITTATALQTFKYFDLNNVMGSFNYYSGKTNNTIPTEFTNELAGWRGDVTGQALAKPSILNDDYKADLDSVNIVSLMKESGLDYLSASNQYYYGIDSGIYTRASRFKYNIGENYLVQEIYKAEGVSSMSELKQVNPYAHHFIVSIQDNQNNFTNNGE